MESNHEERSCPKVIPLMFSKEKLKCRNVKVLRYHQPSSNRDRENSFRIEEYLKLPPITGTYFKKLQEPGVYDGTIQ